MCGEVSVIWLDVGGMLDFVVVCDWCDFFNVSWYCVVEVGVILNLSLWVCDGDMCVVWGSLEKEVGKCSFLEMVGMVLVVIDY